MSGLSYEVVRGKSALRRKQVWRWRVRAANGRILASSEAYTNQVDAVHAANLVALDSTLSDVKVVD